MERASHQIAAGRYEFVMNFPPVASDTETLNYALTHPSGFTIRESQKYLIKTT